MPKGLWNIAGLAAWLAFPRYGLGPRPIDAADVSDWRLVPSRPDQELTELERRLRYGTRSPGTWHRVRGQTWCEDVSEDTKDHFCKRRLRLAVIRQKIAPTVALRPKTTRYCGNRLLADGQPWGFILLLSHLFKRCFCSCEWSTCYTKSRMPAFATAFVSGLVLPVLPAALADGLNSAILEEGLNAAIDDPCLEPPTSRDGFENTLSGIDPDEAWDYYLKLRYLHCNDVGRSTLLTTDTPLLPDQPSGPERVIPPLTELSEIEMIRRIFDGTRIPIAPVPLPPSGLLLGVALAGGFALGRRKRR